MRMRSIRMLDVGPGKSIPCVSLFMDYLERNEDISSLINGIPNGWFMEKKAGGVTASLGLFIDKTGKVLRMKNFSHLT